MSLTRLIIIFLVILALFGGLVFYQFSRPNKPSTQVTINNHTFFVEVATTSAQQQKGLSGKNSLPQDQGMLFVFKTADRYPFWMKEMKFPLDIIFINNNKIVSMAQNVPPLKKDDANPAIYQPDAPVTHALEINAGLAKKYGFKKNDSVTIKLK